MQQDGTPRPAHGWQSQRRRSCQWLTTDMTKPLTVQARAAPVPTVDELKRVYIACDKASERGLLAHWQIAPCSVIYKELKRRAFGGDYDQFHAWSRTRR